MLRIGAVSYLNTRPLVWQLETRLRSQIDPSATVSFDLPSRLADALAQGSLDVALIPTMEFLRGRNYQIVSNAVIGCRGPVWSVRLLSRVPIDQIRTLALDEGSRTSQALVQVLLWQQYKIKPRLLPFPIDVPAEDIAADALLMIGDRAMHPPAGAYREIWDLGDRWCRWSELPFVFAVWAAREDVDTTLLGPIFEASRDAGCENFEPIANEHAGPLGLTTADCVSYFAEHLHFTLGINERRGMELFAKLAGELGLLSDAQGPAALDTVSTTLFQ